MPIVFGGDRVARVSAELAAAFRPGDRLVVVQDTGDLLHVPSAVHELAAGAVDRASAAFGRIGRAVSFPPQLGQIPFSRICAQSAQKVHSNEQIRASDSGGRSRSQHSQLGLSSSIHASSIRHASIAREPEHLQAAGTR